MDKGSTAVNVWWYNSKWLKTPSKIHIYSLIAREILTIFFHNSV